MSDLQKELQYKVAGFSGGCIKSHYEKWAALTSDPDILETVSGLPIDTFDDIPQSTHVQYPFGEKESEFISNEINRLLEKRVIEQCEHETGELVSPIFLREKSDGEGFRMILNLKKLNEVSEYEHFKMDTFKTVLTLIRPGIFMAKLDIKDAYYSVPIREADQKLLKFKFETLLFKFLVLPNGYTKGPRKFTKLLKPILAKLRAMGITLLAYLDDILVLGMSKEECGHHIMIVLRTLQDYGFVIYPTKSITDPHTTMEFLGFIIDSLSMLVTLPTDKSYVLISAWQIAC